MKHNCKIGFRVSPCWLEAACCVMFYTLDGTISIEVSLVFGSIEIQHYGAAWYWRVHGIQSVNITLVEYYRVEVKAV